MTKFHVSPEDGEPRRCTASKKPCKYGADTPHFDNKKNAADYASKNLEKSNSIVNTISKKPTSKTIKDTLIVSKNSSVSTFNRVGYELQSDAGFNKAVDAIGDRETVQTLKEMYALSQERDNLGKDFTSKNIGYSNGNVIYKNDGAKAMRKLIDLADKKPDALKSLALDAGASNNFKDLQNESISINNLSENHSIISGETQDDKNKMSAYTRIGYALMQESNTASYDKIFSSKESKEAFKKAYESTSGYGDKSDDAIRLNEDSLILQGAANDAFNELKEYAKKNPEHFGKITMMGSNLDCSKW